MPSAVSIWKGGTFTAAAAPSRTGYIFGGWKASWNNTTYQAGMSVPAPMGAMLAVYTLTAQWSEARTYQITYAGGTTDTVTGMPATTLVQEGKTFTAGAAPSRTGYYFTGWKASWNDRTYQVGANVPAPTGQAGSGYTLTAQWREPYTYTIT